MSNTNFTCIISKCLNKITGNIPTWKLQWRRGKREGRCLSKSVEVSLRGHPFSTWTQTGETSRGLAGHSFGSQKVACEQDVPIHEPSWVNCSAWLPRKMVTKILIWVQIVLARFNKCVHKTVTCQSGKMTRRTHCAQEHQAVSMAYGLAPGLRPSKKVTLPMENMVSNMTRGSKPQASSLFKYLSSLSISPIS